jgi:hypothetical protein
VLFAQTTKPVTLSDKTPFEEELTIPLRKGGEVKVKASFRFDEAANTVSVTMQSERKLFVFWENIKYRKAFRNKRLCTEKLSYNMTGNTADRFHRVAWFYKALPKPHRKRHMFHAWTEPQGLRPMAAPRQIVNDSLSQTLAVSDTADAYSIRLRDVLFIDEVKQKGAARYYAITYGSDINTEYQITLQRNPCFGFDAQIAAARNARDAVVRSFEAFKSIYDKGVVNSPEGQKLFNELQEALQIQFPVNEDSSACAALQEVQKDYNQYIDSIKALSVTLELPAEESSLNVKIILANARTIDGNVTRWLTSKDKFEREDLEDQCYSIISDTKDMIHQNGARTQEEQDAVAVFKKAEQYFERTCRK